MRALKSSALVLALLLTGGCLMQVEHWVADILAAPDRFWNRTVTVSGRVIEVTPDPPGTREGYFRLVDESDPNGIIVRSFSLPSPGESVVVRGAVSQDPTNALRIMIREDRRVQAEVDWLLWLAIGAGAVALLLLGYTLWERTGRRDALNEPESFRYPETPEPNPFAQAPPHAQSNGPGPESSPKTRAFDPKTKEFERFGYLKVVQGEDAPLEFPLGSSVVMIGRGGGRPNQVELTDETVSREQARILWNRETDSVTLVNESSTNRTKVNGHPIDTTGLSPGDRIGFGATVLEFRADG